MLKPLITKQKFKLTFAFFFFFNATGRLHFCHLDKLDYKEYTQLWQVLYIYELCQFTKMLMCNSFHLYFFYEIRVTLAKRYYVHI